MSDILTVVSVVVGIISIGGVLYTIAYWKGKADTTLKNVCDLPERTKALELKVDVLWSLFVDQVLGGKPALAQRGSGYKLSEKGVACVKEFDEVIEVIKRENGNMTPSDVMTVVLQRIGLQRVMEVAHKHECTTAEILSLLTIRVGIKV